ncbi:MAG: Ni/Fe-hydrogenase cytochrome b subunit [Acidobacteriota bacterium]|nr:MAG: Ni/Fe-hydrogenase cytochrome b subunit [Acidobacteriota bacterium]
MPSSHPAQVRIPFFSPGTYVLIGVTAIGFAFGLVRFLLGLGTVTNLSDDYPWGIWIAIDVACGVALAAGGFMTAALVDIFGKHRFHVLLRPAILTAWLGYAMVAFAVFFDIGRYWNIWRPVFNWQGNSALFEVGMCVMAYLFVLTIEMTPAILDRLSAVQGKAKWLWAQALPGIRIAVTVIKVILPLFLVAGVVLSCMHQSSLGTLMLISPTKLSPLWYTPLLPALFLLSAFMVGFPVVILESILAARLLRREPEMDVLGDLARFVPWTIGFYALFRIGDLAIRIGDFTRLPGASQIVSFAVELGAGVLLPFFLFSRRSIRNSSRWLLFASVLVIGGVVLNRINVYLVGYTPPGVVSRYIPSLGELAVTLAIFSSIVLLYRLFVVAFPILPARTEDDREHVRWREAQVSGFRGARVFRFAGALLLLGFVILYLAVHEEALSGRIGAVQWAKTLQPFRGSASRLGQLEHAGRPEGYRRYYILNSVILNADEDYFEPVRFSHTAHDSYTRGNCGVCHHRFSLDGDDRVGEELHAFHAQLEIVPEGACSNCHDMSSLYIQRCDSCHWASSEGPEENLVGLKGAYHRQCIGCHEEGGGGATLPTDCISCHYPHIPDHSLLVQVPERPTPQQVTANCLSCHEHVGRDIKRTAHWRWYDHRRFSETQLTFAEVDTSESRMLANPNLRYCLACHIGVPGFESRLDFTDETRIDCLACHDTTGTYRRDQAGFTSALDLKVIAERVGRPDRRSCAQCHFRSPGGLNDKLEALEAEFEGREGELDVHMGEIDMRCQDCHRTSQHQIAGNVLGTQSNPLRITCTSCHGKSPHGVVGFVGSHLDEHSTSVSCEACHIPVGGRQAPIRLLVDYSKPLAEAGSQGGTAPIEGRGFRAEEKWESNVVPTYRWDNGVRRMRGLDTEVDLGEVLEMNPPTGVYADPNSLIRPFIVREAVQPADIETGRLVIPKLEDGLWVHRDWTRAIQEGMQELGLPFSGEHTFVQTRFYTSLFHEVVPAREALGCADCHEFRAVDCRRCHSGITAKESQEMVRSIYPNVKGRMNFEDLGYSADPAVSNGRFRSMPLRIGSP